MTPTPLIHIVAFLVFCVAFPVQAGVVKGTVQFNGQGVTGAMVTARHQVSDIAVTVFSDTNGAYEIDALKAGEYTISAKSPGFKSDSAVQNIEADQSLALDMTLKDDANFLSSIPSAQWLSLLPEGDMKREFILNCASCHEVGHSRVLRDGKPRSESDWARSDCTDAID